MKFTKFHITGAITSQKGFTRKKSIYTVGTFLKLIKSTLKSIKDVLIREFGKFCVTEKQEHRVQNAPTEDIW